MGHHEHRTIRVRDLPELIGNGASPRLLLKCQGECAGEYSASKGDYFLSAPDQIMTCCGAPMALVTKRTVYEAWPSVTGSGGGDGVLSVHPG